jgi:putative tryptophan/tyrosine transport system substrate-binding protein
MSGIRRREFITLLGGGAAWPLAARAQQPAMPVIGYLSARSPKTDVPMLAAFRRGLSEGGYVEGNNVAIEFRWGGGQYDPLPELAADLVRRRVSVIVTSGGPGPALAAKAATETIPILFVTAGDPVQEGLVATLSRPGGNITGVGTFFFSLGTKQLGLMRELMPNANPFALLIDPHMASSESQANDTEAAGRAVGQRLIVLRANTEREIDAAFATLVQQRAGALLVATSPFFVTRAHYLITLAARHSLPAMYFRREFVEAGGLMSYGTSTAESYRQLGNYAGKILSGFKPADLPVIQSTKFEFVINLQTTKALGLTVPPGLLAIADEVIE